MLSKEQFKRLTIVSRTADGVFYGTVTEAGKYGQFYAEKHVNKLDEYVKFYYPMYVTDKQRGENDNDKA